jgi:S-adenosylmethionine hydrolase
MAIITLTSDFGLQDHISATVKGQIYQHVHKVQAIVDITHQVVPFNLPQVAYLINSTLPNFSKGTYHCIFVNLFENNSHEIICFEYQHQYVFCADNGLINLITGGETVPVISMPLYNNQPFNIVNFIQTIANGINWIEGGGRMENIGEPKTGFIEKNNLKPMVGENWMEGHIVFIDAYENVVTNIPKVLFEKVCGKRKFKIIFKRDEVISQISESYGSVPQGEKLALFNTSGFLEIAINQGNASGLFGFQNYGSANSGSGLYLQKRLYYQTIKIYFENK